MTVDTAVTTAGALDLTDRVALVTGAAAGIGRAVAGMLHQAGAQVFLVDRDEAAGKRAADELGAGASFGSADLRNADECKQIIDDCSSAHGGLDILVNNAGVYPFAELDDVTPNMFDDVIELNLRAPLLLTQHAAASMASRGGGSIVNIGSMDGLRPTYTGLSVYGASKGGLLTMTRHLALALAPKGIRVNAVIPGGVATDGSRRLTETSDFTAEEQDEIASQFAAQVPLGQRMADPADIAGPVLFFASAVSSYVTGATLLVDGGMMLRS